MRRLCDVWRSNPVDTIKNYSLLLLPVLGMLLLLARLLGFIPFLAYVPLSAS
jgi:hypothetical protein